ncbi:MAG: hypothetical protein M5U10_10875 [Candidatus Methanoperedens sp.]|nr:hypothetical protein [Candidatus Methanoperedens nitroreducens]MDJ1422406.1 hypothetical protein [Candidatus Methanoperedens sp.]
MCEKNKTDKASAEQEICVSIRLPRKYHVFLRNYTTMTGESAEDIAASAMKSYLEMCSSNLGVISREIPWRLENQKTE